MLKFRTAKIILIVAISEIGSCLGLALGGYYGFCSTNLRGLGDVTNYDLERKLMPHNLWRGVDKKSEEQRKNQLCQLQKNAWIRVGKGQGWA